MILPTMTIIVESNLSSASTQLRPWTGCLASLAPIIYT